MLLDDLDGYRARIHAPLFRRLRFNVLHTIDLLEDVQGHINDVEAGQIAPPNQRWVALEGGGRRLELDEELLRLLSEQGMQIWEIAVFMQCSERTVKRWRRRLGIYYRQRNQMSAEELFPVGL
jgi:hypothetical protein